MNFFHSAILMLMVFLERASSLSPATSSAAFTPFSASSKEQAVAAATSSPLASIFSSSKKQTTQVTERRRNWPCQRISDVHFVTFMQAEASTIQAYFNSWASFYGYDFSSTDPLLVRFYFLLSIHAWLHMSMTCNI